MHRPLVKVAYAVLCAAIAGCGSGSNTTSGSIPQLVASRALQGPAPAFSVLYNFGASSTDGTDPAGGPIDVGGTLYGVTNGGGSRLNGVLYSLTASGVESVQFDFANFPNLVTYVDGTFYGTTIYGGTNDQGTIFSVTPSGAFDVLHSFGATGDGAAPETQLTDLNGTLYGTTSFGGSAGYGTVFTIVPGGNYELLHSFAASGDGQYPTSGLTNLNGTLYGLTEDGGSIGWGVLYSIKPSGTEHVLYGFSDSCARPNGLGGNQDNLTRFQGKFYGTCWGRSQGGRIFSIDPNGSNFKVLRTFTDAVHPVGNLVVSGGKLYGVTRGGGKYKHGALYSVDATGNVTILHSFQPADGEEPTGITTENGVLYGTAAEGGANNGGTVFAFTP